MHRRALMSFVEKINFSSFLRKWRCVAAMFVVAVGCVCGAWGATIIWTGNGSDSNWSTTGNWDTGKAPTTGDVVYFKGEKSSTVTIDSVVTISDLHFNSVGTEKITLNFGASDLTVTGWCHFGVGHDANVLINGNGVSSLTNPDGSGQLIVKGGFDDENNTSNVIELENYGSIYVKCAEFYIDHASEGSITFSSTDETGLLYIGKEMNTSLGYSEHIVNNGVNVVVEGYTVTSSVDYDTKVMTVSIARDSGNIPALKYTANVSLSDGGQFLIDDNGTKITEITLTSNVTSATTFSTAENLTTFTITPNSCVDGNSLELKLYLQDGFSCIGTVSYMYSSTGYFVWDGSESTDWAIGANWQGGTAPSVSTDVVIIADGTNDPTISSVATVAAVTINNGAVLTVSQDYSLTATTVDIKSGGELSVTGSVVATNLNVEGTLTLADKSTLNVTDFTVASTGSLSCAGSSTVAFTGTSAWTCSKSYSNILGGVSITGTLTPSSNMYVSGSWTNSSTYTHNSKSVYFTGSGTVASNNSSFYNVIVNSSGTVSLSDDMTVADALTVTSGTLASAANALSVTGTTTNAGTISCTTGSLSFTGDVTNSSAISCTTGSISFNGAYSGSSDSVSVSDGTLTLDTDSSTSIGTLSVTTSATVNGPTSSSCALTFGTLTLNSSPNLTTTGYVTFPSACTTGALTVGNGTITSVLTLGGTVEAASVSVTSSATLTAGNYALSVTGTTTNAGTITGGSGTLTFNGDYSGTGVFTASSGNTIFYGNADFSSCSNFGANGGAVTFVSASSNTLKTYSGQTFNKLYFGGNVTIDISKGPVSAVNLYMQNGAASYLTSAFTAKITSTSAQSLNVTGVSYAMDITRVSATDDVIGTLTIDSNVTVNVTNNIKTHSGTALVVDGKLNAVSLEHSATTSTSTPFTTVKVGTGGILNLFSTLNLAANSGTGNKLSNSGKVTASVITMNSGYSNNGDLTVIANSGIITLTNNSSSTLTIPDGLTFSNIGTLVVNDGTATVSGTYTGDGKITATTGTVKIAGNGTAVTTLEYTGSGFFENSGTGLLTATALLTLASGTTEKLTASGTGSSIAVTAATYNGASVTTVGAVTLPAGSDSTKIGTLTETSGTLTLADGLETGALIVNGGTLITSGTLTSSSITLAADSTMKLGGALSVGGNWTDNGATFTHNSNTVTFTADATISGSTSFYNLSATELGGKTLTISGTPSVTGTFKLTGTSSDSRLTIAGSGSINLTTSQSTGKYLSVGNSVKIYESTGSTLAGSIYSASYSVPSAGTAASNYSDVLANGWNLFIGTMTYVWSGANSTDWGNSTNWKSGVVPGISANSTDGVDVEIPEVASGNHYPAVDVAYSIAKLTVGTSSDSEATVTLSTSVLTVTTTLTNYGTIIYTGNARITSGGTVAINDVLNKGTVEYAGTSVGTITNFSDTDYYNLVVSLGDWTDGGEITVSNNLTVSGGSFTAANALAVSKNVAVSSGTLTTNKNFTVTNALSVSGDASVLFNATSGTTSATSAATATFSTSGSVSFGNDSDDSFELTGGTLELITGTLSLAGTITASGGITLSKNATLAANTTFASAVTLGTDVTLSGGTYTATFENTVGGSTAYGLTIGADGNATNAVFKVTTGGTGSLLSYVTVYGTTGFGSSGDVTITTTGAQTYTGDATLNQNTVLIADTVTFGGNVDGGNKNLTVTGNAVLGSSSNDSETVTSVAVLSITGTTEINTTSITTTGTQTYTGAVLINTLTTLATTSSTVTFGSTVTGANSSTLAITGNAVFGDGSGTDTVSALSSLSVSGTTTVSSSASVTSTVLTQSYTGDVTNNGTITGGTGLITFSGDVTNTNCTITSGTGGITFTGSLTGGTLTGASGATITLSNTADKTFAPTTFTHSDCVFVVAGESTGKTTIGAVYTFGTFKCEVPGKTIYFTTSSDGTSKYVFGSLNILGSEANPVVLTRSGSSDYWYVTVASDNTEVNYAKVSYSISDNSLVSKVTNSSEGDAGTTTNWFSLTYYWYGSSDSLYSNAANWRMSDVTNGTVPSIAPQTSNSNINIVISDSLTSILKLTDSLSIGSLNVYSSQTVDIADKDVAVSGAFTNNGTLRLTGAASQSVKATGTVIHGNNSTIEYYYGGEASTLVTTNAMPSATGYKKLSVTGASTVLTLTEDITAVSVTVGDGTNASSLSLGSYSLTVSGALTNNANSTVAVGSNTLSFGSYSGSGSVTITATGGTITQTGSSESTISTLTLADSTSNTVNGGTGGIVITNAVSNALTTTGLVTLKGTGLTALTVSSGTLTANGNITISGALSNSGTIALAGNTLSFGTSSGEGSVTASTGTVKMTGATDGTISSLTYTDTGAFTNSGSSKLTVSELNLTNEKTQTISSTGSGSIVVTDATYNTASVTAIGTVSIPSGTFGALVVGNGTTASTLSLTGAASLVASSLTVNASSKINQSAISATINGTITNNGTLTFGDVTASGNITNNGTLTLGAVTLSTTGNNTITGTATAANTKFSSLTKSLASDASAATLTISGALTITGDLMLEGANESAKLTISGTSSDSITISSSQTKGKYLSVNASTGPYILSSDSGSFIYTAYNSTTATSSVTHGWNIISGDLVYVWNGSSSTAWATAANWNTGIVPGTTSTSGVVVDIPEVTSGKFYPVVDGAYSIGNFIIGSSSVKTPTVTLLSNVLTVAGTLSNYATIIYQGAARITKNSTSINDVSNSGTVEYNTGTSDKVTAFTNGYYDLKVTSGTWTDGGAISVKHNLSVSVGSFTASNTLEVSNNSTVSSGTLTTNAAFTVTGALSVSNGTLSINAGTGSQTSTVGTISLTGGTVSFGNTAGDTFNVGSGGISVPSAMTAVSGAGTLTATGSTISISHDITLNNNLTFASAVVQGADSVRLSGGTYIATFKSTVGGTTAKNLIIGTENTALTNAVFEVSTGGSGALLSSVTVYGTTGFGVSTGSAVTITTTGAQTYTGNATLYKDTTLVGGINTVTFGGTVNSVSGSNCNLTIGVDSTTATNVKFNAIVGGSVPVGVLIVYGNTALGSSATTITSSGNQTYTGAVTLGGAASFVGGTNTVIFSSTVGGASAFGLTVGASSNATNAMFEATTVGGTGALLGAVTVYGNAELSSNSGISFVSGGAITVDGTTSTGGAATITSTGNQSFKGAITLDGNTSFVANSGSIKIAGSVDSSTANGNIYFKGNVILANSIPTTGISISSGTGTIKFEGTVTGSGQALTLTSNSPTAPAILFSGVVGETSTYLGAITSSGSGAVEFKSEVYAFSVDVTGGTAINTSSITTSKIQKYTGDVTLGVAAITLKGTTVEFVSTVDNATALTVTGNAVFGDMVGNTATLTSLYVSGTSSLNGAFVATTGTQTYNGDATLGVETTLLAGTSSVIFASNVSGSSLTIGDASSNKTNVEFTSSSTVGTVDALTVYGNATLANSVTSFTSGGAITVEGTTSIGAAATISSTGAQSYTGAVTLADTTSFIANNSGTTQTVTFVSTVGGTSACNLTLGSADSNTNVVFEATTIGGGAGALLGSVTVHGNATLANSVTSFTSGGAITVKGKTSIGAAATISSTGAQSYTGAVTLADTTSFIANNSSTAQTVIFVSTVGGTSACNLTVGTNDSSKYTNVIFAETTGTTDSTLLKTVTVYGTTTFGVSTGNTVTLKTTDAQTYNGNATLAQNTTLLAGTNTVTFSGNVSGEYDLTIGDSSTNTTNAKFNGTVNKIKSLLIIGDATINTSLITTTGSQTYSGAVIFGTALASSTLSSSDSGDILFSLTVDGDATNLTVTTSGIVTFADTVGETKPLASLTVGSSSIAAASIKVNCSNITTSGNQTYYGPVTLVVDTTFTSTGVSSAMTFNGTVDATSSGGQSLTIIADKDTGTAVFKDAVGKTKSLGNVKLTGVVTFEDCFIQDASKTYELVAGKVTHSEKEFIGGAATINAGKFIQTGENTDAQSIASIDIKTGATMDWDSTDDGGTLGIGGDYDSIVQAVDEGSLNFHKKNIVFSGSVTLKNVVLLDLIVSSTGSVTQAGNIRVRRHVAVAGSYTPNTLYKLILGNDSANKSNSGDSISGGVATIGTSTSSFGNVVVYQGSTEKTFGNNTLVGTTDGLSSYDSTYGKFSCETLTISETLSSAGSVTFNSAAITTLTNDSSSFAINVNTYLGSTDSQTTIITNDCTLNTTGAVTIGSATGDVATFNGGITHTAGTTNVQGSVVTSNGNVLFGSYTSGIVLKGATTISTSGTSGTTGAVTFNGAISNAASYALTIDSKVGTVTFNEAVGSDSVELGDLQIASSTSITADKTISSSKVTLTGGAVNLNGAVVATNGFTSTGSTFDNTGASVTTTDSAILITHTADENIGGPLSSGNGNISLSSDSTIEILTAVNSTAGNILVDSDSATTISSSGDIVTTTGNVIFGSVKAGALSTAGDITTSGVEENGTGSVTFTNATTLTDSVNISTCAESSAGGFVLFKSDVLASVSYAPSFVVNSGSGTVDFNSNFGPSVSSALGAVFVTGGNVNVHSEANSSFVKSFIVKQSGIYHQDSGSSIVTQNNFAQKNGSTEGTSSNLISGTISSVTGISFASTTYFDNTTLLDGSTYAVAFGKDVHVALPIGEVLKIASTLSPGMTVANNFILYSGTFRPNTSVSVAGDMVLLGDGSGAKTALTEYSDKDSVTGINSLYSYANIGRNTGSVKGSQTTAAINASLSSTFPDGSLMPTSYSGIFDMTNFEGRVITCGKNFYDNGVDLICTSQWTFKIPANNNAYDYFAETYNMSVKNSLVLVNTAVTSSGTIAKISASENCKDEGNNTDGDYANNTSNNVGWDFTHLSIKKVATVNDDILCITFTEPVENSNGEVTTALTQIFYDNGAKIFAGVYSDASCSTALGTGDTDTIYLKTTDGESYRWNTDATGLTSGNEESTDKGRSEIPAAHRSVVPNIQITKATEAIYNTLRDAAKNRIYNFVGDPSDAANANLTEGARYTGTVDNCSPVLVAVYTGQELHTDYDSTVGATSQAEYDSHNFIEFQYSESVNIGNIPAVSTDTISYSDVKNIQSSTSFDSLTEHGGSIADNGSGITVTGFADIASGEVTAGERTLNGTTYIGKESTTVHSLYRKFSTTAQSTADDIVQTHRVRVSIAGFVDGTVTSSDNYLYKNWNGYITSATMPSGQITRVANNFITDIAVELDGTAINNSLDSTGNYNSLPTLDVNSYDVLMGADANSNTSLYGTWDVLHPVFAPYVDGTDNNKWETDGDDSDRVYEIVGTVNNSTSAYLQRVEFHIFDNYQSYSSSDVYQWRTRNGWVNGTTLIKEVPDVIGGSRLFTQDENVSSKNQTTGGIRYSSLYLANSAFTYKYHLNSVSDTRSFGQGQIEQKVRSSIYRNEDQTSADTKNDGLYISIPLNDKDTELTSRTSFVITYDPQYSFITDMAGNRLLETDNNSSTKKLTSIDVTPPAFTMTMAPVSQNKIYVVFSEQLCYEGNAISASTDSDIMNKIAEQFEFASSKNGNIDDDTYSDLSVDSAKFESGNADYTGLLLTLNKNVTFENVKDLWLRIKKGDSVVTGIDGVANYPTLIEDSYRNCMDYHSCHALSDFALNVVKPIYAYDITDSDLGTTDESASLHTVHDFSGDGTNDNRLLTDKDIMMQVQVVGGTDSSGESIETTDKAIIFFDRSIDSGSASDLYNKQTDSELKVWLPTALEALATNKNTPENAAGLSENSVDEKSNLLRYYLIPDANSNDSFNWKANDVVQFMFGLTDSTGTAIKIDQDGDSSTEKVPLYALRLSNENDPSSVDIWQFRMVTEKLQRGGVTILNNVINPTNDEETVIQVDSNAGNLIVAVMTLDGNIIKYLEHGNVTEGTHYYRWNGKNNAGNAVARGLYFVRIIGEGIDETRKVMVVK